MLKLQSSFSGFSVDDIAAAKHFYHDVLGMGLQDQTGGVKLQLPGGHSAWMYAKANHRPAEYTMLNLVVPDIDQSVDELTARGVTFERYPGAPQDPKGIMRGRAADRGPDIAWFKDPAGNILALIESDDRQEL